MKRERNLTFYFISFFVKNGIIVFKLSRLMSMNIFKNFVNNERKKMDFFFSVWNWGWQNIGWNGICQNQKKKLPYFFCVRIWDFLKPRIRLLEIWNQEEQQIRTWESEWAKDSEQTEGDTKMTSAHLKRKMCLPSYQQKCYKIIFFFSKK